MSPRPLLRLPNDLNQTVQRTQSGISPQAIVSPSAVIDEGACIHPGAVIMDNVQIGFGTVVYPNVTIMENCRLGRDVQVFPNSVLYENTIVGDRSILHAGVVLGAFGFGYQSNTGRHVLSAQIGNVVIAEDVEIGANTTIDRGTYDSTTNWRRNENRQPGDGGPQLYDWRTQPALLASWNCG